MSRFLHQLSLWLALALVTGCAGLPRPVDAPVSRALEDVQTTGLARIADAARHEAQIEQTELSGLRLLSNGTHAFEARIALARRAERSLDLQYYLLQQDASGLRLLRELRDAAARGVRVRLLLDDFYTAGQDPLLRDLAAHPNIEIRLFNPLPSRGRLHSLRLALSLHAMPRINHRMHNKLFVADNSLAVTGGRNIADEYFMHGAQANFVDLDLLATGPVVRDLSAVFDRYWNSEQAVPLHALLAPPADAAQARQAFARKVAGLAQDLPVTPLDVLGRPPVGQQLASGRLTQHFARAEVLADAPTKVNGVEADHGEATVHAAALRQMLTARQSVVVTSPYFIPGPQGIEMLQRAAQHGIRVTLLTNAVSATDEPLVHFAYARYREAMLKAGVELYELSPTLAQRSGGLGNFGASMGRLHAKTTVIDGRRIVIGSLNLDPRSRMSNTESVLVIDSPELGRDMLALMRSAGPASAYRVRLGDGQRGTQWLEAGPDGSEQVHRQEPGLTTGLGLMQLLLSPLVPESML